VETGWTRAERGAVAGSVFQRHVARQILKGMPTDGQNVISRESENLGGTEQIAGVQVRIRSSFSRVDVPVCRGCIGGWCLSSDKPMPGLAEHAGR
jgi:hypothetical protein